MIRSVLKSLLKPDAYPDSTSGVALLQTHVSFIFLTDNHAYKIKKPVDFGFLNFSTIDRRRFYCNEEVRLNRRLCPEIYEGVVELRETENGAAFHGNGKVIDYAVKMKRLPAERMLDKLVAAGSVTSETIRKIAHTIAEFHKKAPTSSSVAEYGRLERIMYNWQENFDQLVPFEMTTLPADQRELARSWVTRFSLEHEELFQKRIENGFIRECDGDIHLENICLVNDSIHIFDCIEFNDRFRCSDTAADIAFLLMDLDFHGRHDLAKDSIDEYIAATEDREAAALIDFYKIYRAFVRGKVESFRLNDSGIGPDEQAEARNRAIRYFRLVRGYIERSNLSPTMFITCGLMGSGKSTLASQLAFELGLTCISSDAIRKQMAGISETQPVKDDYGQGFYNKEAREQNYAELLKRTGQSLADGNSVVVDACFASKKQRSAFAELAKSLSVRFIILHVDCGETELKQRLFERESGGVSVSDGRLELLAHQASEFEPPNASEGFCLSLNGHEPSLKLIDEIYFRLAQC